MALLKKPTIQWGPPKKFTTENEDRKISWLELFYDLVYVIAISRITHHLAGHLSISGLLDYTYFFVMIFWGWLNGSLYHDLHGSGGLRTRLMTLWQMMIVAGLVITIDSSPENLLLNATIALMVMQLYITYLWWSVGIYDKHHRKLNRPYTVIYLLSFGLMFSTLFLEQPYVRIIFYITLLLNYLPPFLTNILLRRESANLNLSSSMSERLGLFTIIVFGEVVLGVVNGVITLHELSSGIWLNFALAISVVFALWWIFFTLISDKDCKKGFVNSSLLEILYIPALMSLGMIGVAFSGIFESFTHTDLHSQWLKTSFGLSLALFFLAINGLLYLLSYPKGYERFKKRIHGILFVVILLFFVLGLINLQISLLAYLLIVWGILLSLIFVLNQSWYSFRLDKISKEE